MVVALVLASGLAGAAAGVNKFLTSGVSHNCPAGWDDIPPPQFAVFTVVREEQPYIEEFVMYHLFIGVDIIYIYDNENHPTYGHLFPCNPRVRVVYFPWTPESRGTVFKDLVLRHFFLHFNKLHRWAVHLDGDEFLVLRRHKDIKDFALEYLGDPEATGQAGVALEWLHFDDNGLIRYEDKPVVTRFTRRSSGVHDLQKPLFACKYVARMRNSHEVVFRDDFNRSFVSKTTYGVEASFKLPPGNSRLQSDSIVLHHYKSKSFEEMVRRRVFGRRPNTTFRSRPRDLNATEIEEMSSEVEQIIQRRVGRLQTEGEPARTHAVQDTLLRDFWLANIDATYWATRRYTAGLNPPSRPQSHGQ